MSDLFNEFSWVEFVVSTIFMTAALYYGRHTQRRDDRKKARRAQERGLAEALAQQTLRGRRG